MIWVRLEGGDCSTQLRQALLSEIEHRSALQGKQLDSLRILSVAIEYEARNSGESPVFIQKPLRSLDGGC